MYFHCLGFLPSSSSSNLGLLFYRKILYLENLNINIPMKLSNSTQISIPPHSLPSTLSSNASLPSASLFPWSNSRHVPTTPNSTPSLISFSMRSESHFFAFQSPQLDALEFSFQCPKPIKIHFLFSTKLGFCGFSFNHFSHRSSIGFKCGR